MPSTLVAYHGRQVDKDAVIAQLRRHRDAGELVHGCSEWKDGKGGAIGCTVHSDDLSDYETRFGIPIFVADIKNLIFEKLPINVAREWPERLMSAIVPGSDLSRVHWLLLHWLHTTPEINPGIDHRSVQDLARQCANLIGDLASGKAVAEEAVKAVWASGLRTASELRQAETGPAVDAAVWSAEAVARSAEAWRASDSPKYSADFAAKAVWSAAQGSMTLSSEEEAWIKISDRLIALVEMAPMSRE